MTGVIEFMKKRMMLLMALTAAMLAGCSGKSSAAEQTADVSPVAGSTEAVEQSAGSAVKTAEESVHHVKIHVKDYGAISVELDSTYAPITVENFLSLAESGFYDGLTFHRVIDGFMIQGGDPLGTGMGGAKTTIPGEFSSNGVDNPLSHTRGVISMARSQDKDSASSQFFIMHQDSSHLDGDYAAFGHVTDGMEIVDKICEDTAVADGNGTVVKENQPVIERVEVVD